ncbi:MAG: PD40 domain-containing protein, partial [Deltaproteobacteria bacterium]|nr:PD40 domain-containing protein [Deltaproteobacteria bacterium]
RHLPRCARRGEAPELLYYRDDGNRIPGFYRLSLRPETPAYDAGLELVERAVGSPRSADVDGDCGLVFDSSLPSLRRYGFDDLVRSPLGPATTGAANVARRRLTSGLRARSPDVSPDGRRVAFVRNHGGTTTLEVADLDASGGLGSPRTAARSRPREQVFSPRFAPDSRRIAYGVWTEGGHRDLRILDLETGVVEELFHDRAVDGQPSFSPDGKTLYFSSDRSGISNIYALDLATRRLRQVTNVLGGAFFPEPSPDGRSLVYVGYTSYGYDLWEIPLREEELLPAPPPPPPRPDPERSAPTERWPVVPYDMTETLGPYRYDVEYGPGTFGDAVTISTSGADMTGQHQFGLAFTWDTGLASPAGSASYTYARLPVWLGTSAFRFVAPRAPVQVGDRRLPVRESIIGATTSVSYPIPLDLASQTVSVSYTASAHDTDFPVARLVDPYADALPRARDYFLGSVRAGYWFSNTAGTAFGLSPEQGVTFSLSTDLAGPFTGSDASLTAVEGRAIGYVLSPIGEHQVLALALSGGTAGGSFPGRGFYYTGGFTDADPYDTVRSGLIQGGFVLRGFPPGAFVGRQYNLANLEYRFPLLWVYRGVSTLPAFLNAFTGTLFADYGGAYDRMDSSDPLAVYRLGVGAELRFGFTLGYFLGTNLRLGVARGFGDGALPGLQTYLVAAAQF